ncbi:MAG: HAD-IIIA family hydrolase [Rubrivivax sp.]|nr:HAD-IIIA family hydrolase [Rubrivivax sp.]
MHGAVFLDKDGTLLVNVPYNVDPALVHFTANAFEGLRALAAAGWPLVMITNQSGLASGRFGLAQYEHLQRVVAQRLRDEAGIVLAGWFTCPHAATRPAACACRKPAPGLLHEAAAMHGIDLARSWMVGDTLDDIEAGRRAGCATVLVESGGETEWELTPPWRVPHHRVADLLAASRAIVAGGRSRGDIRVGGGGIGGEIGGEARR